MVKTDASVGTARVVHQDSGADSRLRVTVLFTTPDATLAALHTAGKLAKSLAARIALVAVEGVPFRLALQHPPVSPEFLERQLLALAEAARTDTEEVSIIVCLGRDRKACLQQILQPRSLVVIGGGRWWSRERRLERWLSAQGYQVVFVASGRFADRNGDAQSWSVS